MSDSGTPAQGTFKFFVHWQTEQCGKDCNGPAPCLGLAHNWVKLHNTEDVCCDTIPWIDRKDCVYSGISKASQGAGESLLKVIGNIYYPDWNYQSGTCLNDGKEPIYMKTSKLWLSNSLEECCDQHYSGWNKDKCISRGGSD